MEDDDNELDVSDENLEFMEVWFIYNYNFMGK